MYLFCVACSEHDIISVLVYIQYSTICIHLCNGNGLYDYGRVHVDTPQEMNALADSGDNRMQIITCLSLLTIYLLHIHREGDTRRDFGWNFGN